MFVIAYTITVKRLMVFLVIKAFNRSHYKFSLWEVFGAIALKETII